VLVLTIWAKVPSRGACRRLLVPIILPDACQKGMHAAAARNMLDFGNF
jgi:hypothetical protein